MKENKDKIIKQKFFHYTLWEDYKNGMFKTDVGNENEHIYRAKKLLSNQIDFYNTANNMVRDWNVSATQNLTNLSCNRRAWIGQASCCYKHKIPEYLTRIAWNQLKEETQRLANQTAERIINQWQLKYLDNEQEEIKY